MNEREIFTNALMHSAAEREAYLAEACGDNLALRSQVEALLAEHSQLGSFLESPVPALAKTFDEPPVPPGSGTRIGPYKLLEQIGEGGMGVVYMAAQSHPVERKVALKLIKPGLDSRQVLSRFGAERQALALMDHPNIAKVFDAGSTESGQPYFVMELVNGVPITEYCDTHRLKPRERLELFIPVCKALQHAHQKGVIHRDLKPSNVMIAQYDGKPVPKVIDFGVAKAAGPKLTVETLYTGFGTVVGTLEYMSPEQAVRNQLDVDTRSDIYSLGVLLYELLTGTTPLDHKRVKKAAILELLRVIQEEDPPKPSTRLSSTDELPSIAANRSVEPRKLALLVRGELDWIVMKALEKDRTRRYETANGLARDLDLYLHDKPVEACPPSAVYRFRKFARRNRAALAMAVVVTVALLLGIVGTTWQAFLAISQRDRAVAAEGLAQDQRKLAQLKADEANKARTQADTNFRKARQAVDDMYTQVAEKWLARQPKLEPLQREFLQKALRFYEEFAQRTSPDPAVRLEVAQAYRRVADIQHRLGQPAQAERAFERAIDGLQKLADEFPAATQYRQNLAGTLQSFGVLLGDTGRYIEDERANRRALALQEKLVADFPNVPEYRRDLGRGYFFLGGVLRSLGKPEKEKAHRLGLAIQTKLVAEFPAVPVYREHLADSHQKLNEFREAAAILEKLVADFPDLPQYRNELADVYYWHGFPLALQEAEPLLRKALALQRRLADDFPAVTDYRGDLARSLWRLGMKLRDANRTTEAENFLREAAVIGEKLAAESPAVHYYRGRLADVYRQLAILLQNSGRLPEAEAAYRQSIGLYENLVVDFPDAQPNYRMSLSETYVKFRSLLSAAGRFEDAKDLFRRAYERVSQDPAALRSIAVSMQAAGLQTEAELAFRKSIEMYTKLTVKFPKDLDDQLQLANCHNELATTLKSAGRFTEAEQEYRQAVALKKKLVGESPANPDYGFHLAHSHLGMGYLLRETRRPQEAEKSFRQALNLFEKLAAEFPSRDNYRMEVGHTLWQLGYQASDAGRQEEAEKAQRRALAVFQKLAADFPQNRFYQWEQCFSDWNIAGLMRRLGHLNDAERALRDAIEVCEKAVAEAPDDAGFRDRLARSHHDLADCLRAAKQFRDAEAQFRQAVAIWEKLADDTPSEPVFLVHAAYDHLRNLMPLVQSQNRQDDAEECCRRTIALTKRLPAAELAIEDRRSLALDARSRLAELLLAKKKYADAAKNAQELQTASPGNAEASLEAAAILDRCASAAFADASLSPVVRKSVANGYNNQALDLAVNASKQGPLKAYVANNLAWSFATRPEVALRSPGVAVVLAKKAVELEPNQGMWWNTLGAAQYRAGDWKAADEAFQKSMELRNGGDSVDWFFLAMTSWRRGQKEKARNWYNAATLWTAKYAPNQDDLKRFRAEAATLLAIRLQPLPQNLDGAAVAQALFDADANTKAIWCWQALAENQMQSGRWTEARRFLRRWGELQPDDLFAHYSLGALLARAGDIDAYRQHCQELLTRCAQTDQPEWAERTAKLCLILPPTGETLAAAGRISDRAIRLGQNHWVLTYAQEAAALAAYRRGEFKACLEWCDKVLTKESENVIYRNSQTHYIRAMALAHLGKTDEAQTSVKKGDALLRDMQAAAKAQIPRGWWHDLAMCELLQQATQQALAKPLSADHEVRVDAPRKP